MQTKVISSLPSRLIKFLLFQFLISFPVLPAAAQTTDEVVMLTAGQNAVRELAGGGLHSYKIKAAANQYLKIVVEQKGIDVVVELYLPDGNKLLEIDSPNGTQGPEPLEAVAPVDGDYLLKVRSLEDKAPAGRYEVKIVELRTATEKDRHQIAARKAYDEAVQLQNKRTAESLRNAIKKYEEALALWRALENRSREAQTLNDMGAVYFLLGERRKALDYLLRTLPLRRTLGERDAEATTLINIGVVYNHLGEQQKALDHFEQAVPIVRSLGNRSTEATLFNNMASVYGDLSENQKALDYFGQALSIRRALGERDAEAETLNNIGAVYRRLGAPQKALDQYAQALPLRRSAGNRFGEAAALNNIGLVYTDLAEMQKSLDHYGQALLIVRQIGDRNGEAATLSNIGLVYNRLGEPQRALDYYTQSLPLYRAVGDRRGEARTLGNIGFVHDNLGDKKKALDYYTQVLPLYRAVGDRIGEAQTINNIGGIHDDLGEKQKALEYFTQALSLARAAEDRSIEARTLNNIGAVHNSLGDNQTARGFYEQALPLYRAVGNSSDEARTLYNLAALELKTGDLAAALKNIEATIAIVESLRTKIGSRELRSSYSATVQNFYELYIDLLMRLHEQKPTEDFAGRAFLANERARARGLLELLAEAKVNIRQGVDEKLLAREIELQQRISARTDARIRLLNSKHTREQADKISREIKELSDDYEKIEAQIRTASPRYAALSQPRSFTLNEIRKNVLDRDTILLEYALGAERSYLWVVTPDSIEGYKLPNRETINAAARAFYKSVSARPTAAAAIKEYATAAKTLSEMILKPAAKHLQKNKRLLIVGDGFLQYIPFGALPRSGGNQQSPVPLVIDHEIISLPSASTLAALRDEKIIRPKFTKEIMVIADPVFEATDLRLKRDPQLTGQTKVVPEPNTDRALQGFLRSLNDPATLEPAQPLRRLSYTRREALTIAALVPKTQSRIYLDFEANYANATGAEAGQYRILHFGTHGLLNSEQPELTGILFSMIDENGNPQPHSLLRLGEVYNLKLPVELVVLSGCQTALGKEIRGEGLVGLTRGFMYAGSPRVVASLWKVDDAMTAEVMKHFYRAMLGTKRLAPAAALREAQKEMLRQKIEPFYWSAFIIQGEWR